ncbi:hypothetical protein P7C70_g1627, partial [Phenoliferia sp. Uapishka_3]
MFENNKAIDGCVPDDGSGRNTDPGTEQIAWLEQQLLLARARGMQVWLTGHVPPTKENWYERCFQTYGELVLSFHDTIVGQLFGHMNVDHASFISASEVLPSSQSYSHLPSSLSPPISTFRSGGSIADALKASYESLPSRRKTRLQDYSVVNINPSVIPTYFPAVRIWQYNTSVESRWRQPMDLEVRSGNETVGRALWQDEEDAEELEVEDVEEKESEEETFAYSTAISAVAATLKLAPSALLSLILPAHPVITFLSNSLIKKRKDKKKKRKKHHKRPAPRMPRHFSPDSPSLTNKYLSPLGYTQFYIDLDDANLHSGFGPGEEAQQLEAESTLLSKRPSPNWDVEYVTFGAEAYAKGLLGKGQEGGPVTVGALPIEMRRAMEESEGSSEASREKDLVKRLKEGKLVPYELEDLTVGSWVGLARRVVKNKKRWRKFVKKMFVGSGVKA